MNTQEPRQIAVFADLDDTLRQGAREGEYIVSADQIVLLPGAVTGVRALNAARTPVFIVTNQPGVAKGQSTYAEVERLNQLTLERFAQEGATIDGIKFCPHHPKGSVAEYAIECRCRKPAPGMLEELARAHGIDLTRSYMVGDYLWDLQTGAAAGCQTILVKTRSAEKIKESIEQGKPTQVVEAFDDAVAWILDQVYVKVHD